MLTGPNERRIPLRLAGGSDDTERADAARNRRLLLAAAQELVDREGAAAVTMDAVARQAGVGKGTVFRRFGSRASLMFALLDHAETELQSAYLSGPPPLGPGAPALTRLLAFGRARLTMTMDHLDVLIEAGGSSAEFVTHPVWSATNRHIQVLLQQLGFGQRVEVVAIAVQAPLGAAEVRHLHDVVGLDLPEIIAGWEAMVTTLAAGVDR